MQDDKNLFFPDGKSKNTSVVKNKYSSLKTSA